jgi:hypothetical protein
MTTTDVEKDETVDASVGSSGASLEIELAASGRTEKIRLSGCTFGDAVHFCAPGLWQEYEDELERELASAASQELRDQSIDSVELVLYEDGSLQEIRVRGCTAEQAGMFGRIIEPTPPKTEHAIELIQHTIVDRRAERTRTDDNG